MRTPKSLGALASLRALASSGAAECMLARFEEAGLEETRLESFDTDGWGRGSSKITEGMTVVDDCIFATSTSGDDRSRCSPTRPTTPPPTRWTRSTQSPCASRRLCSRNSVVSSPARGSSPSTRSPTTSANRVRDGTAGDRHLTVRLARRAELGGEKLIRDRERRR